MEFRFAVSDIFHQPVAEIGHTLLPAGFKGDRRQLWDTISKVTDVVNALGTASANAQGLTRPITTADRLRNSDQQILYLLIDQNSNQGKGAVTGMLKTGRKALYVFDRDGHHYQVQAPCILDFYVHETRQRSGYGKKLFEYMLKREDVDPKSLAIDRPSDKFLAFLNKHYALSSPIRQMNNFVVYDGFFPKNTNKEQDKQNGESPHKGSNGLQAQIITSPYGRYGAPRPPCSMGQIIHNQSATVTGNEQTGVGQSFPHYHVHPPQEHQIDSSGQREQRQKVQQPTSGQPLQQNEVSATSDGALISSQPPNGMGLSNANYATHESNVSKMPGCNAESKIKMVKLPAVGNGICNDSEEVRIEKLTRANSAPLNTNAEAKTEYHWPFSVPTQDYIYEKRFHHPPIPSLPKGVNQILQPDQYMLQKQVVPPKDEVDAYGRPRVATVGSAPTVHSSHANAHGQCRHYYQPSCPTQQMSQHGMESKDPYHNVTSYNFYAPRPSGNQQYHNFQPYYFDQQRYQQQLEQQYALNQLQQQQNQQEQMWKGYQNWLQYQYMMQNPQLAQGNMYLQQLAQPHVSPEMSQTAFGQTTNLGSHTVMPQPYLQQPQLSSQPSQQMVQPSSQQVLQPPLRQHPPPPQVVTAPSRLTTPQAEIITPEKLLPQSPAEEFPRPTYIPDKQNQRESIYMDKEKTYQKSSQSERIPSVHNLMIEGSSYQSEPHVQQQQVSHNVANLTPSVPAIAPPVQEEPKSALVEPPPMKTVPSSPSVQNPAHSAQTQSLAPPAPAPVGVLSQQQQPIIAPLTPEQIMQLPPQQQIMYYQKMLAQSVHAQNASNYNLYNPVFGIPPQPLPPPVQTIVQPHPQTQPPPQIQLHETKECRQIEEKEMCAPINDQCVNQVDAGAAGDTSLPAQKRDILSPPYPFPIILKSNLEPLQPSIPFRRYSKPDVPFPEQQADNAKNKAQTRSSPSFAIRPGTVRGSRAANNPLSVVKIKSTLEMGRQDRAVCSRTPRPCSIYESCGTTGVRKHQTSTKEPSDGNNRSPAHAQHKENKYFLRSSAMIKEFFKQLP